jgi:hypothetical protein
MDVRKNCAHTVYNAGNVPDAVEEVDVRYPTAREDG